MDVALDDAGTGIRALRVEHMACLALPYHATYAIPCCDIMQYHAISCDPMPRHAMSSHSDVAAFFILSHSFVFTRPHQEH